VHPQRYRGYAYLLLVVSLAVLMQPLALNWPLLTSLSSIIMAMPELTAPCSQRLALCVQGSGRPPRDCISDSSSLSDQEAVLCAADSGIGQQ
jgi:hypothetical protein